MSVALIGRKAGMTRIFTDAGETVPVTVIEVLPNRITQVKSVDKDGYRAIQVSFGKKRPQLLSKAAAGHYAKANVEPGKSMVEFRLTEKEGADLAVGSRAQGRHLRSGRHCRCHGHHDRQGLRRHDEASQLRRPPRLARCVRVAQNAWLHRPAPDPGPRVPGQAHVGPHGRRAPHGRESEGRRDRRRT